MCKKFTDSIIRHLLLLMIQILCSSGQRKKRITFLLLKKLFCFNVQAFFIHFFLQFLRPSLYILLYLSSSFLKMLVMLMLFSLSFCGRLFDFFFSYFH